MEGAQDIGKHKGNVAGQGFREDGGQGRERIVGADSDARDGTIGEDENRGDGVYVLLDLSRNTLLVDFILLDTASVGQSRGVEDANLGERSRILIMLKSSITYHYAVLALKFI